MATRVQSNSKVTGDSYRDLVITATIANEMDKDLRRRLFRFFLRNVLIEDRVTAGGVLDTLTANGDFKMNDKGETAASLRKAIDPEFKRLAVENAERQARRGGALGGGGPRRFLVIGSVGETATLADRQSNGPAPASVAPITSAPSKRKAPARKAAARARRTPVT